MVGDKLPQEQSDKLSVEHQRLISIINSMSDGVIAVDENKVVINSNSIALDLLDVNVLNGLQVADCLRLVDANNNPIDISNKLNEIDKEFTTKEWLITYQDKSQANLYVSISRVRSGYGGVLAGWVIILRDITLERSVEEERDDFISVASHELRTPIAITEGNISNALLAAENSSVDLAIKNSLKAAHDQVVFLSSLLNDLSMLSRANRGNLAMNIVEVDITEFVKTLATDYRPQAEAKGLTLSAEIREDIGKVATSELYLREIIQNFITNSIKYTEKGNISISVEAKAENVVFKVVDTGIGISKSDQNKLFKKFFRSDDFRVKKASGTGLGLYVTAKLIKLIGAKLSIESQLDHGTEIILSIPRAIPNQSIKS